MICSLEDAHALISLERNALRFKTVSSVIIFIVQVLGVWFIFFHPLKCNALVNEGEEFQAAFYIVEPFTTSQVWLCTLKGLWASLSSKTSGNNQETRPGRPQRSHCSALKCIRNVFWCKTSDLWIVYFKTSSVRQQLLFSMSFSCLRREAEKSPLLLQPTQPESLDYPIKCSRINSWILMLASNILLDNM